MLAAVSGVPAACTFYDPLKGPDYYSECPNFALSPLPVVDGTGTITGGMRKFVDSIAGIDPTKPNNLGNYIPVAVPDVVTYPGSDYYEIELADYTQQMHSDLIGPCTTDAAGVTTCTGSTPGTKLRGYKQTNSGTDVSSCTPPPTIPPDGGLNCGAGDNTVAPPARRYYLGPVIVAVRERPVRIKFTNLLDPDDGGNLFIPVDTTVMGAGRGPGSDWTDPKGDEPCALTPKTGSGVNIAVIDTGFDMAHPDLQGQQARYLDMGSPYYGWPIVYDDMAAQYWYNGLIGSWVADTSYAAWDMGGYIDYYGRHLLD